MGPFGVVAGGALAGAGHGALGLVLLEVLKSPATVRVSPWISCVSWGWAGTDAHDPDGIEAAYLQMPDFDGPRDFLAALAQAEIIGEHRPHAVRYGRRPALD